MTQMSTPGPTAGSAEDPAGRDDWAPWGAAEAGGERQVGWTTWGRGDVRPRRKGPLVAAFVVAALGFVALVGFVLFFLSGSAGAAGGCGGG